MKKLLLLALLFISCKSATSVDAKIDGTYCISQYYYKSITNGYPFEVTSNRKTADSKFCLSFASFDDSTGGVRANGQYSVWVDSAGSTSDSILYQVLYQQNEDGFYQKVGQFYYLGFPAGGEWLPVITYTWNGSNLITGFWSYKDSTYSDTLAVTFKK